MPQLAPASRCTDALTGRRDLAPQGPFHLLGSPVAALQKSSTWRFAWLNQIEIYFSIVQRKALTPNDLLVGRPWPSDSKSFERQFETIAQPF